MGFIPDLVDEGRFESRSRGSGFGPGMFFWKLLARETDINSADLFGGTDFCNFIW